MKVLRSLLLVIFLSYSCTNDDVIPEDVISYRNLNFKWMVENTSEYASFEFNCSGNFIVVKNNRLLSYPTIILGKYTPLSTRRMELTGLGMMDISTLNDKHFRFTLKLDSDPDNDIEFEAIKAPLIDGASSLHQLFRTWELVSFNGEDVKAKMIAIFGAAGTFLVKWPLEEPSLATWQWRDQSKRQICVLWNPDDDCSEENQIRIIGLSDEQLMIYESPDEGVEYLSVLKSAH